MATPQFGIPTIIDYGNAASGTIAGPPAIDNRVFVGSFGSILRPPSFAPPVRPILERLTPQRINATALIATTQARIRAQALTRAVQARNLGVGTVRALRMRRGITLR